MTTATVRLPRLQSPILALALATGAAVFAALLPFGLRHAFLFVVGVAMGATLFHAAFGFTVAYRRLIVEKDMSGIAAQLVMLAAATLLFAPFLARGEAFGIEVGGAVAPVGASMIFGAFIFGVGMQLAGGCGSGTLFTAGGGNVRMLLVLAFFCLGGFWASLDMHRWRVLSGEIELAFGDALGWPLAVALQLAVLAAIYVALRASGAHLVQPLWWEPGRWRQSLLRGPWPLVLGAALLALLNALTLVLAGHPWSITWAFTLWAAKAAVAVGWDPSSSPFWSGGFQQAALERSVLADVTSIMDIGIILGALAAASLAGKVAPSLRIPARSLLAAAIGGLLLGYGARLAYGCNIGAFFSGVASTSLHGWVWIVAAFLGNALGVRLRPLFGLAR
jgi:uncharacterized membrane protein YedE/YeeE